MFHSHGFWFPIFSEAIDCLTQMKYLTYKFAREGKLNLPYTHTHTHTHYDETNLYKNTSTDYEYSLRLNKNQKQTNLKNLKI